MYPCNCGETLTRSVQENAANRTAATRTRAQVCERPELFIGLGACDNRWVCASNFLRSPCTRTRRDARCGTVRGEARRHARRVPLRAEQMLISGFRVRCDSRLERNTMIGSGRFRRCACADLFRPFRCSRSMGPDLTGPGSNGDVQNAASTQGSFRDQTAVLSP